MISIILIIFLCLIGACACIGICTFISDVCFPKLSRSICDLLRNGCCYVIHSCNHCDDHLNNLCFDDTKFKDEKQLNNV